MDFTNRELATYIWLAFFFTALMSISGVRISAYEVFKAFFARKLLSIWGAIGIYIAGSVFFLAKLGLWKWDNLKTTVLWVLSFALAAVFEVSKISKGEDERKFFVKILQDTVAISAIITFIVELHSFSFIVEMVAVPLLTFLALLQALAKNDPKLEAIDRLLKTVLFICGLWYIGYSLYETVVDFRNTATTNNFREFGIPVLLTLAFIPFLYCTLIFITYESSFNRLIWPINDPRLRRRAKIEAVIRFGPRLELLRRWSSNIVTVRPSNLDELRQAFRETVDNALDEKFPPYIDPSEGWSPHLARHFLKGIGIEANPYHRAFGEEWSASSPMVSIGNEISNPNRMAYYLAGDQRIVKCLKLRLYVNRTEAQIEADEKFIVAASELLGIALGPTAANSSREILSYLKPFKETINGTDVSLTVEMWPQNVSGGFERTLCLRIN